MRLLLLSFFVVGVACTVPAMPVDGDRTDEAGPDAAVDPDSAVGPDAAVDPDSAVGPDVDASPALDAPRDARAPSPVGLPCTSHEDCASSFCVDGVCCASACDGPCETCAGARPGECLPHAAGTDPDADCDPEPAASCGRTGACDGAGACALQPEGTPCAPSTCASGLERIARTCDGRGVCADRGTRECAPFACAGPACATSCGGPEGCAAGQYCDAVAGVCVPQRAHGERCAAAVECASGFCVDGVCCDAACDGACESCLQVATGAPDGRCAPATGGTDPDGDCEAQPATSCGTSGACDGARACARWPAGTLCAPGSCVDGIERTTSRCDGAGRCVEGAAVACAPYVCGPTGCLPSCASDAECAVGFHCESGSCLANRSLGAPCTRGGECASGFCVDGVCCDRACDGTCEACTATLRGGGTDGVCGPIAAGTDPSGECAAQPATSCGFDGSCDGRGACRRWAAGTVCVAASCSAGVESRADTCDGLGLCVDGGTRACTPYVCGTTACRTDCTTDAHCASTHHCSGGSCVPKLANGAACTAPNQCLSGFCVDGVCCDAACTGLCEACTSSRTGAADGTCAPVRAGTDPDAECPDDGAASCGRDGTCNGARACRLYAAGTVCVAASCSAGVESRADTCDGLGSCVDGGTASCTPYVCGTTACRTDCTTDAHCASTHYCSGGSCVPKLANGAACTAPNQCLSGFCVDGVCCDAACTGLCEACDVAGSVGACAPIPAGTDPADECAGASACDGARACG